MNLAGAESPADPIKQVDHEVEGSKAESRPKVSD